MFKKILVLLAGFTAAVSFSQETVNTIPLSLKGNRDVFQIVETSKNEVTLFLSDKKKVNAMRLNEQLQIMDSLSSSHPGKVYSDMIGYINNGNQYKLFWSSGNSKEIASQTYDFEKRTVVINTFSSKLKDEKVIQKFSDNGVFYMATVLKDSNILKLYIFDKADHLTEKTINLEGYKFYLSNFKKSTLYGVLQEDLMPFENAFSLQQITTESPTSLTYSSKKRKCYIQNGTFIISFDTNPSYTQLINITLSNLSAVEKIYKTPFLQTTEFTPARSNSFLMDDKLFQIKLTSEKMILSIKDSQDNILKELPTLVTEEINYKNSPITQENGSSSNQRILEKTNQFLRKVSNSNCGISGYKINGNYFLKIGSVSEVQDNNGAMYGAMFGMAGVLIASAISNPTFDNFNSYSSRKVVYINTLFDNNGNHISGDINPVAFDKIQNHIEKNKNLVSPTLFKMNNTYYLGNYDTYTKQYILRKFVD
ncbi:hypothetical protein [Flavobacterium sp.]|uniref:hypothetical protein n=1 Tax=Flavobacterium sp. TaxID=239 RepID=UPI003D6C3596